MIQKVSIVLLVLCIAYASAGLLKRDVLFSENQYYNEDAWVKGSAAPLTEEMEITLFLQQRNLDVLNFEFKRRTDPKSPMWRQWMTIDEITSIVAPPRSQVRVVKSWLKAHGVRHVQDKGDALYITCSVDSANRLFETTFVEYQHIASGLSVIRHTGELSMPHVVNEVVDFVSGVASFPRVGRKFDHFKELGLEMLDDSQDKVVPYTIDQLYQINYQLVGQINHEASVGPIEFLGDSSFSASDLQNFQKQNALPEQAVPQSNIIGPYSAFFPDTESTLDMQFASGVSWNTTSWFWTTDGWMLEFANDFYNTQNIPYSISMSWGWTEDNQCSITACSSSEDYVSKCNTEFQKIGLRGVSIFASSGDQGAPGDGDSNCFSKKEPVTSIFPGASPYVTSVGATMLLNENQITGDQPIPSRNVSINDQPVPPICSQYTCADASKMVEVACQYPEALITTGGGFSVYSNRQQTADYQDEVVSAYLSSAVGLPPSSDYNANNRGFPDISALGHNYLIYVNGRWGTVDGTSCSAPVWAGLTALLNSFELNNGNPNLGFLNPLLYNAYADNPEIFFDVIDGNNSCTESTCCSYGYPAAPGWDAVTGLGTINNFEGLLTYVTSYYN